MSVSEISVSVTFPDVDASEREKMAASLIDSLNSISDSKVVIRRLKDNDSAQSIGATVLLVLGSTSVVAIAKGIASWISRSGGAKISIKKDGRIEAVNIDSADAARIVEAIYAGSEKK